MTRRTPRATTITMTRRGKLARGDQRMTIKAGISNASTVKRPTCRTRLYTPTWSRSTRRVPMARCATHPRVAVAEADLGRILIRGLIQGQRTSLRRLREMADQSIHCAALKKFIWQSLRTICRMMALDRARRIKRSVRRSDRACMTILSFRIWYSSQSWLTRMGASSNRKMRCPLFQGHYLTKVLEVALWLLVTAPMDTLSRLIVCSRTWVKHPRPHRWYIRDSRQPLSKLLSQKMLVSIWISNSKMECHSHHSNSKWHWMGRPITWNHLHRLMDRRLLTLLLQDLELSIKMVMERFLGQVFQISSQRVNLSRAVSLRMKGKEKAKIMEQVSTYIQEPMAREVLIRHKESTASVHPKTTKEAHRAPAAKKLWSQRIPRPSGSATTTSWPTTTAKWCSLTRFSPSTCTVWATE